MKPIKCPNCGKRMEPRCKRSKDVPNLVGAQLVCDDCGVSGPWCHAPTDFGAVRKASRLTREWIARMEAAAEEKSALAYTCGFEHGKQCRELHPYQLKIIDEFGNVPEGFPLVQPMHSGKRIQMSDIVGPLCAAVDVDKIEGAK